MKHLIFTALFLLSYTVAVRAQIVFPTPNQVEMQTGNLILGKKVSMYAEDTTAFYLNLFREEVLSHTPIKWQKKESKADICWITDSSLPPEGYRIKIHPQQMVISASDKGGFTYAVQTLRQWVAGSAGSITFACASVTDYPRTQWRCFLLDSGRQFQKIATIRKYIDMASLLKMNYFHWHLTEGLGWRIEIKQYPHLTRTGGSVGKGEEQQGFYTQEEIRDIIEYARQRNITIVPEIDMPGHAEAALSAYPELGCTGGPYETAVEYGVHKDVLCVGSDKTLPFVKDVLTEVMQLFPSRYIHIGGDECPRDRWKECPKCQALIKAQGWKDTKQYEAEDKLQSYFMTEVEKFVEENGRRIIGWDEILAGGATPNATVMAWRNAEYGAEAAKKGYDVIMTPCGQLYFSAMDVLNLSGDNAIRKVYDFNPVLSDMTETDAAHIKGIQACLWSEDIETMEQIEYRLLPRLAALAEITWNGFDKQNRDYHEFALRMFNIIKRYDKYGLSYHKGAFEVTSDYENDTLNRKLSIRLNTLGNRKIYYTLDGSEPTEASQLYKEPFTINSNAILKAKVIMPGETDNSLVCDTISVNKATFCPVTLAGQPSPTYTYKGASILTDGLTGDTRYNTGRWLGFLCDLNATVDLGKETEVSSAAFRTDVAIGSAVMDITGMEVWCSADGKHFTKVAESSKPVLKKDDPDGIYRHELTFDTQQARYVRIVGKITPKLPSWHTWPGGDAFIFVDEIYVN